MKEVTAKQSSELHHMSCDKDTSQNEFGRCTHAPLNDAVSRLGTHNLLPHRLLITHAVDDNHFVARLDCAVYKAGLELQTATNFKVFNAPTYEVALIWVGPLDCSSMFLCCVAVALLDEFNASQDALSAHTMVKTNWTHQRLD